ncbi:hypothetical protein AS034_01940 [[Bacillus] enclensis]|uniref:Uncharacterized protein n=1 Tax=[Bacillus] enclensis TaxID=1402860 RepID=A0A0V8HPY4_9BACI|nr:hypothetical protein [[Bacillus] enclensis]KSU64620.1 hypothetical protein AS034_01940 [[Bacillus] enclensis]SCB77195.1 hypothetical protein GA0061094_0402 [[Bacillus] enclensis]
MNKESYLDIASDFHLFIEGITTSSITYLAWTSAVVAALLALTTIIFSQFNERLIYHSNEILGEIKKLIKIKEITPNEFNSKLSEIINILSNQIVYKFTYIFFSIISYSSLIIWLFSGMGYKINQPQEDQTLGNSFVITLSTTIISATFFFLPIILKQFNKNPPLKIDNKNRIKYKNVSNFFESNFNISDNELIVDYLSPSIKINLDYNENVILKFHHELPIKDLYYIFEFIDESNNKQLLKINNDSSNLYMEYLIHSSLKGENNFRGLFELIKNSTQLRLYVVTGNRKDSFVTIINLALENSGLDEIRLFCEESIRISPPHWVTSFLKSRDKFKCYIDIDQVKKYKLKHKNK